MRFAIISDVDFTPAHLIRSLRLNKGYTVNELASRSRCSKSAISRYENGNRTPTIDAFNRIVMALDYEVVVVKKRRGDEANPASKEV